MPLPAHHHYVPAFLLREWESGPDNRLTAYWWENKKFLVDRHKAKYVARQKHLYSLKKGNGDWDVGVEKNFMGPKLDDPAGAVHKMILAGKLPTLSAQDASKWSRFLVSLLLRLPHVIKDIKQKGADALREQIAMRPEEYEAIRRGSPESTLEEWVSNHMPHAYENLGIQAIPKLINSRLLNEAICNATWIAMPLRANGYDLLISDCPLILEGSLSRTFLMALPLSPHQMFVASNSGDIAARLSAWSEKEIIKKTNCSMVGNTRDSIFSTGRLHDRLIYKYLGTR